MDNISMAAAAMGRIKSERKAASSRENGKKGGRPREYYHLRYNDFSGSIGVSCSHGHTITLIDKKTFAGSWHQMLLGSDGFKCLECERLGIVKILRGDRPRKIAVDPKVCKHPPARIYAWSGEDAAGKFTSVVCCDCGAVLHC